MKIRILAMAAVAAASLVASSAQAGVWELQYTGVGAPNVLSADLFGTFNDATNGIFNDGIAGHNILNISGTVGSDVITGLISNPNQPFDYNNGSFDYDNNIFLAPSYVNWFGAYFHSATTNYNIFATHGNSAGSSIELYSQNPGGNSIGAFTSAAAVPEPTAWALMLLGFGGLGAVLRSQRKALRTA